MDFVFMHSRGRATLFRTVNIIYRSLTGRLGISSYYKNITVRAHGQLVDSFDLVAGPFATNAGGQWSEFYLHGR